VFWVEKIGQHYRNTYVEVQLDNIKYNLEKIAEVIGGIKNKEIMAVVKADGYGHGAFEVATVALEVGATMLGVALLDEALYLRNKGITAPILVLGYTEVQHAKYAANHNISLTAIDLNWIKELQIENLNSRVNVHLKIDTGMNRLGIRNKDELYQILDIVKSNPNIYLEGVFTHFATADEIKVDYYEKQAAMFQEYVDIIETNGIGVKYIHSSNSAASIRFPQNAYQICRIGIAMYGLTPSVEMIPEIPFDLKSALSLHSVISSVKQVSDVDSISYGATYTPNSTEWIGIVPIGYADGWRRSLQGFYVLVDGQKCEIVGRVCMDQMMVRLPYRVPVGSKVTLIGRQKDEEITANDIAKYLRTINYEVTCMISSRVPRIFFENKSIIKVVNHVLKD
jgi:alanine racemase